MADVNVTVAVDGKTVFVAGAAGAPDGCACAIAGLSMALDHFKAISPAKAQAAQIKVQTDLNAAAASKPQDTSL
jgi:hypothetical protein